MKGKIGFSILAAALLSLLLSVAAFAAEGFTPGSNAVYFVSNGDGSDSNAGTSAGAPLKTLGKAYSYLKQTNGGTIVISGTVSIANAFSPADAGGAVVFTSVYGGVNYAETNDAKLSVAASMAFSNDTYFQSIRLNVTKSSLCFSGRCHNFGFGSGVTVLNGSGADDFTYPMLVGGWNAPGDLNDCSNSKDYTVSVYSGTWSSLYGGHRRTSGSQPVCRLSGDVAVDIRGGTFKDVVSATGMNIHTGRVYMRISGGAFGKQVEAFRRLGTISSDAAGSVHEYTADTLVEISGGTFYANFRLAEDNVSTTGVTYPLKCDTTVVVTGGTFKGKVLGYGVIGSVLLKYDDSVLDESQIDGFPAYKTGSQSMSSAATEKARFTNPIETRPDPYVTEKDGIYYYCFSSSVTIDGTSYAAVKVAAHGSVPFGNLSAQLRTVFNASMTSNAYAQKDYWAPELHYFDADTVGTANAGWYIYVAADNGSNENHRMFVLRATEPENPLSDYKMVGKITDSTNRWAIDGTILQLNGSIYFVWSGWEGTANVRQNIYIAKMSNPWTISSERVLLSTPYYSWETIDSPDVNEGPQVLQYKGSTHIVYSASGSWDRYYCYGMLTLTGSNPLSASSWYKASSPVFQSGNGIYGPGHGSFVQDDGGNWWMIYHANPSLSVPSDSSWWAERKTYTKQFSFTTKTIDGKSYYYPSFGSPAADGGTQYIYVRTADYHASGDHLWSPLKKVSDGSTVKLVKTCYICGAQSTMHQVAPPKVSVSTGLDGGNKLTITPAVTATGYLIYRSTSESTGYAQIGTTTSTTYTDTSAKIGTTYYYKVKQYKKNAYNSLNNDSGKLYSGATAAVSYSTKPAPIEFSVYYDGSIVKLSWTASATAEKYRIFRKLEGDTSWDDTLRMTADTSFTDSTVEVGKTYVYSVQEWTRVGDGYAYSPLSVERQKTVTATRMATPTLSAAAASDGVKLTSTAVDGADGYKFYRSTDGKTYTQVGKAQTTTYTDTTAAAGTIYTYECRAYMNDGDATVYSPMSSPTALVARTPAAIPFTVDYDGSTVKLSWKASASAEKYRIFRREEGESSWGSELRLTAATSFEDTTVEDGKTYVYSVQEWMRVGDGYIYSPLDTELYKTVTVTRMEMPKLGAAAGTDGIVLTLTAVDGADGYEFYRSADGKTFERIGQSTEATYTDTTVDAGTTYIYKCRAYMEDGASTIYSSLSEVASAVLDAFAESSSGETYNAVAKRAGANDFTLLTRVRESDKTTVDTTGGRDAKYVYCVIGDYIVPAKENTESGGCRRIELARADTEAIIFSDTPLVCYGDANADGKLSLADVLSTLKYASGETVEVDLAATDSNCDCAIGIADALRTLHAVLN